MKGIITRRDLLKRPWLIISNFGLLVFLKALFLKDQPFLSLVQRPHEKVSAALQPYTSTMDVFSYFERRLGNLFLNLATRFQEIKQARHFYNELAKEKMGQYELLQFLKSFAGKRKIRSEKWQPHLEKIDTLESILERGEERLKHPLSFREAIQLTESLTFSEINEVYVDLKDSIYSNRAAAIGSLLRSERHYEDLCHKGIRRLSKLADELDDLGENGASQN